MIVQTAPAPLRVRALAMATVAVRITRESNRLDLVKVGADLMREAGQLARRAPQPWRVVHTRRRPAA